MSDKTKIQEALHRPEAEHASLRTATSIAPAAVQTDSGLAAFQSAAGNMAIQRLFKGGGIQAKLKIGPSGDKYEQEADCVADRIMRMPAPAVQRKPT